MKKLLRKHHLLQCESLEERQLMAGDTTRPLAYDPSLLATPRTFDGTANNVAKSEWGSTGEDFTRRGAASYADGISSLAGADRPSPRLVSNLVSAQSESILNPQQWSDMLWQWGQFIDHDLDLTLSATPTESAPISVPKGDPYFDPTGTGTATISLSRSIYDPTTGTTTANPRQQVNSITAWIDGSMIYGSDEATALSLRTMSGGQLKTSDANLLPTDANGFFQTGDIRVNEQVGLISMQTLWMREHNRVAAELAAKNPTWSDEQLYQGARAIVIAEVQVITYKEFLPALLGPNWAPAYSGYKANVNPDVSNLFATAGFRLGHTLLSPELARLNDDGSVIPQGNLSLRESFFAPQEVVETGIDPVLKGLATQQSQALDTKLIDDVRNFLFGPPGAGGFDLASLNIQRGRDHGLPSYNQARAEMGLPKVKSFAEITRDPATQASLKAAYGTVDKIDVWVGALAEDKAPGSGVGPLLKAIVSDQFVRARDGDRYWYQREFKGEQLRQLEQTTLADVMRRNTDIETLQRNVFFTATAPQNRTVTPPPTQNPAPKPGSPPPPPAPRELVNPNPTKPTGSGTQTGTSQTPPAAPARPTNATPPAAPTSAPTPPRPAQPTTATLAKPATPPTQATDAVFATGTNGLVPPRFTASKL